MQTNWERFHEAVVILAGSGPVKQRLAEAYLAHLQEVLFDPDTAGLIANFSIRQVGWFVLFSELALGLVAPARPLADSRSMPPSDSGSD